MPFSFFAGPHILTIAVFTLTGIVVLVLIIALLVLRYNFDLFLCYFQAWVIKLFLKSAF